jgi:hypothetical protein
VPDRRLSWADGVLGTTHTLIPSMTRSLTDRASALRDEVDAAIRDAYATKVRKWSIWTSLSIRFLLGWLRAGGKGGFTPLRLEEPGRAPPRSGPGERCGFSKFRGNALTRRYRRVGSAMKRPTCHD